MVVPLPVVELKAFNKFENTYDALSAATMLIDSKPSKGLRKFLQKHCDGKTLAVADSKLGNAVKENLKIDCLQNSAMMELMRGLRSQLTELMSGLTEQDLGPVSLGLSHSLSRYKPIVMLPQTIVVLWRSLLQTMLRLIL